MIESSSSTRFPHEYRVTKHDPAFRSETGVFQRDEWTSISDVGKEFADGVLTYESYKTIEQSYVMVGVEFMIESCSMPLFVRDLEDTQKCSGLKEGQSLLKEDLSQAIGEILREEYWARLESEDGFLHFGYDYYMYVGAKRDCSNSRLIAERSGLFVEAFVSPHHPPADNL